MWQLIATVFCVFIVFDSVKSDAAINQDTYLNALHTNHQHQHQHSDYDYQPDYQQDNFHSGYDYQPAVKPHYGPPPPVYGPPAPSYGPPSYGPSPVYHEAMPYHHTGGDWFWDKFKFKLSLFTVGKILLKLIIFKKIIKFLALICLLLFLPKLKSLKEDFEGSSNESSEYRGFSEQEKLNGRINEITDFALTAFETFSRKYDGCKREQVWCRVQRMFDTVDAKYPYEKIVKLYLPDANVTAETNELPSN